MNEIPKQFFELQRLVEELVKIDNAMFDTFEALQNGLRLTKKVRWKFDCYQIRRNHILDDMNKISVCQICQKLHPTGLDSFFHTCGDDQR